MELELNRIHLTGYDTVLDTTVFQEETLETIVPDASPDILRLVDTQGTVLLKSKTASDGRVTLTGTARLTVLYLPDGGTGPCRMEVHIPFGLTVEEKRIKTGCQIGAVLKVSSADARTVNPRKVVVRAEIAADIKVYVGSIIHLCTGISAAEGTAEQRLEVHRPICISAVQEKQISFEDTLMIPAGRPAAEEIMSSRVQLICNESKLIGSKLIFKGEAAVQVFYRPAGGGLDTADFLLPISQIMEVSGVGEEGKCSVEMALSAADLTLGADGRSISAALSMLAQVAVREERNLELLADTYSTCCPVCVEQTAYDYPRCQAEGIGHQTVREIIETGMVIRSVVGAYSSLGRMEQVRERTQLRLSTEVLVTAFCLTEESELCAISHVFEVNCPVEVPESCSCRFGCRCMDLIATPAASGVEVRFTLNFPYINLQDTHAVVVKDVAVEAAAEEDKLPQPSIVLRVMEDGERLWDVAKRYRTTVGDILRANGLEVEQAAAGTLLLIPRKR